MNALSQYWEGYKITDRNFKIIIEQILKASAYDWWEHVRSDVKTIDEFKNKFLKEYWNASIQAAVRRELEFGF